MLAPSHLQLVCLPASVGPPKHDQVRSRLTRSLFGWLEGCTWTTKDTRSTPLNGGLHKSTVAILTVGCFKWHSTCLAAQ
ncbi:hypothetical protein PSTG_19520, partial [Puccinia striiformis f. sp. tritici PST-78]